jgi:tetratricopeptide (TPR) repeat protein
VTLPTTPKNAFPSTTESSLSSARAPSSPTPRIAPSQPATDRDAPPRSRSLTHAERWDYQLGRRSFERNEVELALEHLTRLLETRDQFADVHYMVGVLQDRQDDLPAAGRSFTRALRINPRYTEAMLALASIREREGDFDRSREITERARALAGPSEGPLDATTRAKLANLQAELGDAYRDAGELREAVEAYRKALDRCPAFHDIRMRLGVALRDAGLPSQALDEFRRILRVNPDFLDANVQLGLTLYTLARSDEAVREWTAVLGRDPTREDARMYLRLVTKQG